MPEVESTKEQESSKHDQSHSNSLLEDAYDVCSNALSEIRKHPGETALAAGTLALTVVAFRTKAFGLAEKLSPTIAQSKKLFAPLEMSTGMKKAESSLANAGSLLNLKPEPLGSSTLPTPWMKRTTARLVADHHKGLEKPNVSKALSQDILGASAKPLSPEVVSEVSRKALTPEGINELASGAKQKLPAMGDIHSTANPFNFFDHKGHAWVPPSESAKGLRLSQNQLTVGSGESLESLISKDLLRQDMKLGFASRGRRYTQMDEAAIIQSGRNVRAETYLQKVYGAVVASNRKGIAPPEILLSAIDDLKALK